ncbi:hypothetical protein FIBSPDRAFT_880618, partial [Athelia psychrophila]
MVRDASASILLQVCRGARPFLRCAIQKSTLHLKLLLVLMGNGRWVRKRERENKS